MGVGCDIIRVDSHALQPTSISIRRVIRLVKVNPENLEPTLVQDVPASLRIVTSRRKCSRPLGRQIQKRLDAVIVDGGLN
jgi:hypothetical protein